MKKYAWLMLGLAITLGSCEEGDHKDGDDQYRRGAPRSEGMPTRKDKRNVDTSIIPSSDEQAEVRTDTVIERRRP